MQLQIQRRRAYYDNAQIIQRCACVCKPLRYVKTAACYSVKQGSVWGPWVFTLCRTSSLDFDNELGFLDQTMRFGVSIA